MSKASEWAEGVDLATWRPTIDGAWFTSDCQATVVLWPERRIGLSIRRPDDSRYNFAHLDHVEAVKFARWILDTFGDGQ